MLEFLDYVDQCGKATSVITAATQSGERRFKLVIHSGVEMIKEPLRILADFLTCISSKGLKEETLQLQTWGLKAENGIYYL